MDKIKLIFTPLPRAEAEKIILKVYSRFFELRQTKIMKGMGGNG